MCALLAVPKQLLEEVGPDTSDPFLLSDYMHGNVGESYSTSSVAPCPCWGEPALPWFVCIPGTSSRLASLSCGGSHPLVSAHSEGMEMASAGSRGEEDTQGHPCRQQSTCAGRMECGMGKDRQEQAAGTWGTRSTLCLSLHLLVTAGGWYKGPRFSRLQEDRMIFTSSLAAFAHLWGMCPSWVSCSTWGNRTGRGMADLLDGPSSTQGSSQRQPDPKPLQQGQQVHEGAGHQAPMLGLGWTGRVGAQRLNNPQSPTTSRATVWLLSCLWTFLFQQARLPSGSFPSCTVCRH